jgi:hypothetical protein
VIFYISEEAEISISMAEDGNVGKYLPDNG